MTLLVRRTAALFIDAWRRVCERERVTGTVPTRDSTGNYKRAALTD